MGQLANDIHDEAVARVPAAPVANPADLMSGPDLLAIFTVIETAVAALELLTRGARILRTAGVPDNAADGEDGDLAINLATTFLYAKAGGTWTALFKLKGDKGDNVKGDTGLSAYAVALANGYQGSEVQWLASLGRAGDPGKSAYQVAVEGGFTGNVAAWLESLKGQPGGAGQRGNVFIWQSYAPTEELAAVGDCWIYTISASKVAFYKCTGVTVEDKGVWSLRYTSPDGGTGNGGAAYELPVATASKLGGVKSAGAGLTGNVVVNTDGSMTAPADAALAKYDPTFSAVTPDAANNNTVTIATAGRFVVNVTLLLNVTLTLALTGTVSGATGTVLLTHDNTSNSYTVTLPAGSKGTVTVLQAAGAATELSWLFDGSNYYWTSKTY